MQKTVTIVMGSKNDIEVMKKAGEVLKEFGITYEIRALSAHRTPSKVIELAQGFKESGTKVVIAGAGMAAHLPGVMAALTTLPVIGVPLGSGGMGGMDALLAIAQMPPGIPVATVAVNGAKNAGILAVQILAVGDEKIAEKLAEYRKKMVGEVEAADAEILKMSFLK